MEEPMTESTDPPTRIDLIDDPAAADGECWRTFVAGDYVLRREEATAENTVSAAVRERIAAADVSLVNFEAPVVDDGPEPVNKSGPVVENPGEAPAAVVDAGFDLCTLANNHVRDYGPEGVAATVEALSAVGLEWVGVGSNHDAAFEPVVIGPEGVSPPEQERSTDGPAVGVINVCEREFNIATEDSWGAAWLSHPKARATVRDAAEEFDALVVVAHGGVEYAPFPAPELQTCLREFVDLGADLVLAHHPHVPQGWEQYGHGTICYSLGNFLFDSMTGNENTAWGLAIEVEWAGATPVALELVPIEVVDDAVQELGERQDREERLAYLHRLAEITADPSELERYWQEIAIRLFYQRYSNWIHVGAGVNLPRARANPHDADAQRPLWDLEARRKEILTLLTVTRMESHRWTITKALAVLTGETEDVRTETTTDEAVWLLSQAEK